MNERTDEYSKVDRDLERYEQMINTRATQAMRYLLTPWLKFSGKILIEWSRFSQSRGESPEIALEAARASNGIYLFKLLSSIKVSELLLTIQPPLRLPRSIVGHSSMKEKVISSFSYKIGGLDHQSLGCGIKLVSDTSKDCIFLTIVAEVDEPEVLLALIYDPYKDRLFEANMLFETFAECNGKAIHLTKSVCQLKTARIGLIVGEEEYRESIGTGKEVVHTSPLGGLREYLKSNVFNIQTTGSVRGIISRFLDSELDIVVFDRGLFEMFDDVFYFCRVLDINVRQLYLYNPWDDSQKDKYSYQAYAISKSTSLVSEIEAAIQPFLITNWVNNFPPSPSTPIRFSN